MNRRQFTQTLAAVGILPALPVTLPAVAAPAAAPIASQYLYPWAAQYARIHNACSPSLLAADLKVAPDVAQVLYNRLLANGIVKAPGLAGISQAAKPFYANVRFPGAVGEVSDQLRRAANGPRKIQMNLDQESPKAETLASDDGEVDVLQADECISPIPAPEAAE